MSGRKILVEHVGQYATHQQALKWSLALLGKNITAIEFGVGHYSTELMHEAVSKSLLSVESDEEWMNKFIHLQNDVHKFQFIHPTNWERDIAAMDKNVDLVFIDSYSGPSRVVAMQAFADTATLIVVHDQENVFDNPVACYEGQYESVMRFKYRKPWKVGSNITAILSNKIRL